MNDVLFIHIFDNFLPKWFAWQWEFFTTTGFVHQIQLVVGIEAFNCITCGSEKKRIKRIFVLDASYAKKTFYLSPADFFTIPSESLEGSDITENKKL